MQTSFYFFFFCNNRSFELDNVKFERIFSIQSCRDPLPGATENVKKNKSLVCLLFLFLVFQFFFSIFYLFILLALVDANL